MNLYDLDAIEVRSTMEAGRQTIIGDPCDRHALPNGRQLIYELMFVIGAPESLRKVVTLIKKDAGKKNLIWRTLPEVEQDPKSKGINFKLYMRYAFTDESLTQGETNVG